MLDCIVVGAGPAGGSAAYHLARRDRQVLLLEQAKLPRLKACAGGVSPQVARWFDCDLRSVVDHGVDRLRFTWKLSDPVEAELPSAEPFWMVRRDRFDHFLVEQAANLGARVEDGTTVAAVSAEGDGWLVSLGDRAYRCRYLIAADGAKGSLAQWLGFPSQKRRYAQACELDVPLSERPDSTAHFEFGLVRNGYIWVFPKSDGYSIGIGTFRGNEETDFRGLLATYLDGFGLSADLDRILPHPLCIWDGSQPLHRGSALLVGEAASLTDPFTAEGIRPALLSGMRAAEAIDRAIAGESKALAGYSRTIQQEWGDSMAWAKRISSVFYRVPNLGYQIGIKRPTAPQRMAQILVGELDYSDIATRVIRRLTTGFLPGMR
ncbi:geranylgeranyl reductase family protein [Synechococcus elongatus IITB4]|uniref:geranylgeranyl reductase family protein n=1 Tax=Synechococcus elongatus TaxID=32046 RepID=UPI0030D3B4F3